MKEKSLLIFDQVGEQVRWLTYHIANQGYAEFYFLQGGATSVLKDQEYRGAGWKQNQLSRKGMPDGPAGDGE